MARRSHAGKKQKAAPAAQKNPESVSKEVTALGKEVAATLRAVVESEELRAVGSELTNSLQRVSEKVVAAVKTAAKSERPKAVGSHLGKVVRTGSKRGMDATERVRNNLATGLREIGQELSRLAQRLNK